MDLTHIITQTWLLAVLAVAMIFPIMISLFAFRVIRKSAVKTFGLKK